MGNRDWVQNPQTYTKARKKSYHVEGKINGVQITFLIDTGEEVSLICASVVRLEVRKSSVSPVSITQEPISIQGETDINLNLGPLKTSWKFLVTDNLSESLGADFIESHHPTSWGIADNKFWLDDMGIPPKEIKNVCMVREDSHSPVIAKCTVELPARQQVIIPMRTKDNSSKGGLFEPTKTPGGILMSKTAVQGGKDFSFWVRAVNLTPDPVTIFKNQITGVLSEVEGISEPSFLNTGRETFTVSNVKADGQTENRLRELGVDLSKCELGSTEQEQLEKLILSYSDIFSKNKRDLGKC